MGEESPLSGVSQVLRALDMLQIAIHHERCQAAVEAAASIVAMMADDEEAFGAMLRMHLEHFPDESPENLREGYKAMVPVLMHVAQTHEVGSRNSVLREAGLGDAVIVTDDIDSVIESVHARAVFEKAQNLMPTLFDDLEEPTS